MFSNFVNGFFFGFGFLLAFVVVGLVIFFVKERYDKKQYQKYFKEAFLRAADAFINQLEEQELYLEVQDFKKILQEIKAGVASYEYLSQRYEIVVESKYVMEDDEQSVREVMIESIRKKF
jgi:hypothetical protein